MVTANKRRELQRTVANSVTALSEKTLERQRIVRLQDLVAQVPGLSLESDDKTSVRVVLRGFNTGSAGSTAASLLDDVPTSADNAVTNAAINSPNFDTYDLQRVEVLRGPQGTLYGATSEGGLVKYVTNQPDTSAFKGGLETGIEGEPDGGIGGSLKGFVNLPLADGKAALRVSAWNDWLPGYIDNPQTGKTDTNSAQQYGWRASLLVTPIPELSIRLTAQRQSLFSNNADSVAVVGAGMNPAAPPSNQLSLINGLRNSTYFSQPSQNETALYYANVDYDLEWAHLTSITAFSYGKYNQFFDATNTNVAPGVPIGAYLSGMQYNVPLAVDERQNSNTDKFSQEVAARLRPRADAVRTRSRVARRRLLHARNGGLPAKSRCTLASAVDFRAVPTGRWCKFLRSTLRMGGVRPGRLPHHTDLRHRGGRPLERRGAALGFRFRLLPAVWSVNVTGRDIFQRPRCAVFGCAALAPDRGHDAVRAPRHRLPAWRTEYANSRHKRPHELCTGPHGEL